MTVHCADCKAFFCRGEGKLEATPDHCPMRGDFPDFEELYPEGRSRNFLTRAALVEAQGYCRWTRLREVGEFARLMEYKRVGLAHCPDMAREAEQVGTFLREFGLEPTLPPSSAARDPLGQAEFFSNQATDLNVLAGMCVGHESVFLHATEAPAVSLIARDTRLRHNPVAGLYTSRSYLKAELFGHWPREERPPFQGWELSTLYRFACGATNNGQASRSRVAEAMAVAHGLGVHHIGVSFCVGFREEAKILSRLLKSNGFQVSSVCCKTGSVPKEEAGIQDAQKVRPGTAEMICNPVAQAELLNRDDVQFVLVLGQCVGHDAATLQHLEAPAVCLVAKDRVLAHNTVAALYDS
jgi:uncharacterized metal-binding protein